MMNTRKLRNCLSYFSLVFLISCGSSSKKVVIPSYGEAKKKVLSGGPLVEPPIEERMKLKGGKHGPIKQGDPAPYTGVVMNNAKAEELVAIKAEREKLRRLLEATRLQLGTSKLIYEATMEKLRFEAKRSWWERNRGVVGLVIGVVIGVGTTVGLVYALTRGNALSTGTSTTPIRNTKSPLRPYTHARSPNAVLRF